MSDTTVTRNTMTVDDWVAYYLAHPEALRDFVITANEQAERMADELNAIEEAQRINEYEMWNGPRPFDWPPQRGGLK